MPIVQLSTEAEVGLDIFRIIRFISLLWSIREKMEEAGVPQSSTWTDPKSYMDISLEKVSLSPNVGNQAFNTGSLRHMKETTHANWPKWWLLTWLHMISSFFLIWKTWGTKVCSLVKRTVPIFHELTEDLEMITCLQDGRKIFIF